jgi:hypothetical protein
MEAARWGRVRRDRRVGAHALEESVSMRRLSRRRPDGLASTDMVEPTAALTLFPRFPHISQPLPGRYRRWMEPPNPLKIAAALREQLTQLRALIEIAPDSREYATVAELLVRALHQFDKIADVPARQ